MITSIAIRLDSGTPIGSGHLVRCHTLATALRRRGANVRFVCRQRPGDMSDRLAADGFVVHRLPLSSDDALSRDTVGAQWLGETIERDATDTIAALGGKPLDWLVVDHYAAGAHWHAQLRPHVERIMVVDDLADRALDCDVLLDQNWFGSRTEARYDELVAPARTRLLGPRYALLQPEYAERRRVASKRSSGVRRVFVYFGAGDPTNETAKALDALSRPQLADLAVDVVIGPCHPDPRGVEHAVQRRSGATLYHEVGSLASLMLTADVAVGAGGATTWERLCLGVPSIVTTIAANQEPIARALHEHGLIRWLGGSGQTSATSYADALISAPTPSPQQSPLVDGRGAQRVVEVMMPSVRGDLVLRPATSDDVLDFFDWRNEPFARAMSFSSAPIVWSEHVAWFHRRLHDRDTEMFVLEARGLPVGQLRLDLTPATATVSYSVDRLARGRGWGAWMIDEVIRMSEALRSRVIKAEVRIENAASRRIFQRLGWAERLGADGRLMYSRPYAPTNLYDNR